MYGGQTLTLSGHIGYKNVKTPFGQEWSQAVSLSGKKDAAVFHTSVEHQHGNIVSLLPEPVHGRLHFRIERDHCGGILQVVHGAQI